MISNNVSKFVIALWCSRKADKVRNQGKLCLEVNLRLLAMYTADTLLFRHLPTLTALLNMPRYLCETWARKYNLLGSHLSILHL